MGSIRIKINGALRKFMDEKHMPYELDREISDRGVEAAAVIADLGLPLDMVEAVFRNGKVINIYDKVESGDKVAFFPYGTPGPYRVFLGMLRENLKREKAKKGP